MFTPDSTAFLAALKANNNRDWFQAHKAQYDAALRLPAKAFSTALEAELSHKYDTTTTAKLFRINRDLRFSRDKTPYNTHMHMSFADPATGAAWMVGLEIDRLVIGYGVFAFDKHQLARWRAAVAGPNGLALETALSRFLEQKFRLSEPELKRVPSPYKKDHPRAELLRCKGIAAWQDLPLGDAFGEAAPARLSGQLSAFDPLRSWMRDHMR